MYDFYLSNELDNPVELDFGGTSVNGETISVDSISIKKDGKPWLMTSGEFPFSRYSEGEWEKGLRKMKAGGIQVVSSYIFWIHHEEERGIYRFDGCRDIRRFAKLCKKVGLGFLPKIGPWVTAECKNGGFPDWVLDMEEVDGKVHGNKPEFMKVVREYFTKLFEQVHDMMWKDGGCIVGIQIENEYTIHRAFDFEDGRAYMTGLKEMLIEIGFDVPLYFRTGWGRAIITGDNLLPFFGAYCDAPWDNGLDEAPAKNRFLIEDQRIEDIFGKGIEANFVESDVVTDELSEKLKKYYKQMKPTPCLTIELGGGMQPSIHRRIVSEDADTEALTICMLGRGANMLGYYVYHGATNPNGVNGTLESTPNGVMSHQYPRKSYDFGAPIGEDTMLKESYHTLKKRLLVVEEFGELLAVANPFFPAENATDENDIVSPRICVRHDPKSNAGFIFISNHLRKSTLPQRMFDINVHTNEGELKIPTIHTFNHEMRIIPFNLPVEGGRIVSTNAEILTRVGDRYFFYTDKKAIYNVEGDVKITTLSEKDALYSWKFGDMLYICDQCLYEEDGNIYMDTLYTDNTIATYNADGVRAEKTYSVDEIAQSEVAFKLVSDSADEKVYEVDLSNAVTEGVEDILMTVDFLGDSAEIYADGEIISDWYTTGEDYRITLKRFGYPKNITVKVVPSAPIETRYFDLPVKFGHELTAVKLQTLYKTKI